MKDIHAHKRAHIHEPDLILTEVAEWESFHFHKWIIIQFFALFIQQSSYMSIAIFQQTHLMAPEMVWFALKNLKRRAPL